MLVFDTGGDCVVLTGRRKRTFGSENEMSLHWIVFLVDPVFTRGMEMELCKGVSGAICDQ